MRKDNWAWVWHYRFVFLLDQQEAFRRDGGTEGDKLISQVLIETIADNGMLIQVLKEVSDIFVREAEEE